MIPLPHNTVSKLYYFEKRIKSFYEKNGHTSIPFDGRKLQEMVEASHKELSALFLKIWDPPMGAHLLNKFYTCRGNIHDFYLGLDGNNREMFSNIDW